MNNSAFLPTGNTVTFLANTSGSVPTPVQAVSKGLGSIQYRCINSGNVTVFLGVGQTAAAATANAVVVTSSSFSIPLLSGTDEIIAFPPNAFFTGITSAGNASVYITPGNGI